MREAVDDSRATCPQPRGDHDRVILHFDYDCFYAQVVENQRPALRGRPLGIQQKGILATCNYAARRRGVRKLMLVAEARRACPELALVRGEDLSPFRAVSRRLYGVLRAAVADWGGRAERLGLDEVFLDVTDLVAHNAALLNRRDPARSFFCLSREDPTRGFPFDATAVAGHVTGSPAPDAQEALGDPLYARLLLGSHLARHLRLGLEGEGYTSACGVATNKVLAKLAGARHKPRDQTTLLVGLGDGDVARFMDPHGLRAVPGVGARATHAIESHMLGAQARTDTYTAGSTFTVGECRAHPGMGPALLEALLAGHGGARGAGARVWALLHGVDAAEVKPATDLPTQIGVEDTYQARPLATLPEVARELRRLAGALLRRMRADLVEVGGGGGGAGDGPPPPPRWLARPRTLRLAARPWTPPAEGRPYGFARASRSQPLPGFVFGIAAGGGPGADGDDDAAAARLVAECLLPMFHRLEAAGAAGGGAGGGYSVAMLNVCVANMDVVAGGSGAGAGAGRDISAMFRRQEETLREFRVRGDEEEEEAPGRAGLGGDGVSAEEDEGEEDEEEEASWDGGGITDGGEACALCGHYVPAFAATAHDRYHVLGD